MNALPTGTPAKPVSEAKIRQIKKRIGTARLTVASFCRFFGHLIGKTHTVIAQPEHKVPTAAVSPDGYVYYNPDYVDSLSDAELAGLVVHETLHPALLCWRRQGSRKTMCVATVPAAHCPRCAGQSPTCPHEITFSLWNLAHDLSFNPEIILLANKCRAKGKIKLPKDAVLEPQYEGWSAERIYDDKLSTMKKSKKGYVDACGGVGGAIGKYATGIGDDLRPDLAKSETGKRAARGDKTAEQKLANDWRVSTIAAAMAHERKYGRGHLPGGFQKMVAALQECKVDWQDVLSQWIGENGNKLDFSMRRPRRRFDPNTLYLPSYLKTGIDDIVVLWDTSGSMGGRETTILSELINGICEDLGLRLRIICIDARIHSDTRDVKEACDMIGKIKGGGGSNFCPAFDLLEKEQFSGVVVAFTDGHIGVPETKPPLIKDVLWCIEPKSGGFGDVDPTGRNGNSPWGQVLVMDD
jgi:predicted metal-dependent peptidase